MNQKFNRAVVEVVQHCAYGDRDVGIMTVSQALDLPDIPALAYRHPDILQAQAGVFLSRKELARYAGL